MKHWRVAVLLERERGGFSSYERTIRMTYTEAFAEATKYETLGYKAKLEYDPPTPEEMKGPALPPIDLGA